jgi:predicted kinase
MIVLGLCGPAGSGKTFAALHLMERHGFVRLRFAEPMRAMLRGLGCTAEELDGALKETPSFRLCGRTPREAMQTLGTEWGRALIDPDLWVRAWRDRLDALAEETPQARIVADDARFANEAAAIWSLGGSLIRIDRAGLAPPCPAAAAHASETQQLHYDARLVNSGEPEAFRTALDEALARLIG